MKICQNSATHNSPHPRLGLLPRVVTPFAPADQSVSPVAICYLDYALATILRLTNITNQPLTILDLVVNQAFEPGAELAASFQLFRYPVQVEPGLTFEPILQPPSTARLPLDCAYPKLPKTVAVSTNLGSFSFQVKGDSSA